MMDAQETRRLLELAAKAAGKTIHKSGPSSDGRRAWMDDGSYWQPFDDDGDSRRLEVALRLSVVRSLRGDAMAMNHDFSVSVTETAGEDQCATTRLAVLRAAATVGEQMENKQS